MGRGPLRRRGADKTPGKFTFADAIDAKFNSKGVKLAAAISALVVSACYLIPQMVGAGSLVTPLLGLPHHVGVILVGAIVITIVATAGMTSTTYVQFIKGGLLVCFSLVLVIALLVRGLSTQPDKNGTADYRSFPTMSAVMTEGRLQSAEAAYAVAEVRELKGLTLAKLTRDGTTSWWKVERGADGAVTLLQSQYAATSPDGSTIINGAPGTPENKLVPVGNMESVSGRAGEAARSGPVGPLRFLGLIGDEGSSVKLWRSAKLTDGDASVTVYYPMIVEGNKVLRPGLRFKFEGTPWTGSTSRPSCSPSSWALRRPAHPDPVLHRPEPGSGQEVDDRRDRGNRRVLHPYPLHGARRHDKRRGEPDR